MNSKQACKLLNFSQRIAWIYTEFALKSVDYLEVLTTVNYPRNRGSWSNAPNLFSYTK